MHFSTAYYLMLLYMAVMFKPVIPVIMDAYDHAFHESIHLATIHEKYGSHHLDKALADAGSDNENNKSQKGTTNEVPVHITADNVSCYFSIPGLRKQYNLFTYFRLSAISLSRLSPPPRS